MPLLVATGTAAAALGLLTVVGGRPSDAPAVAVTPAPSPPPARLVTAVRRGPHLPILATVVPGPSQSLVWGGGRLWGPGIGGLLRISPAGLSVTTSSRYTGLCVDSQVAYGAGGIWATAGQCGAGGWVYEFDRGTRIRRSIRIPAPAVGVAVWHGLVWVTTTAGQNSRWAVVRIDPATGAATPVGGRLDAGGDPAAGYGVGPVLAVGGGRFWTVGNDGGLIRMTIGSSGQVDGIVQHGHSTSTGLALGDAVLWTGLDLDVDPLDPQTGKTAGEGLRPPSAPVALAFGYGELWIATSGYEIYGFRPGTTSMALVARLGFQPNTLLAAGGYLWATVGNTLARIGPIPTA